MRVAPPLDVIGASFALLAISGCGEQQRPASAAATVSATPAARATPQPAPASVQATYSTFAANVRDPE